MLAELLSHPKGLFCPAENNRRSFYSYYDNLVPRVLSLTPWTGAEQREWSAEGNAGDRAEKTGTNRRAIQKWPSFIWGFPVTKVMPMVKLCVEWLRKLLPYLDSQVNILSIFGLSKFLFCL